MGIYKFFWNESEQSQVYDEKYIIAYVINQEGETEIHFATMPLPYHNHIAADYKAMMIREGKSVQSVGGGGLVTINPQDKSLKTYGSSGGYGPVDVDVVEKCLSETIAKQGYQCVVTVTSEIRG